MDMEEIAKIYGFDSERDFHCMVASLDLSTPDKRVEFRKWQMGDGTKTGLLKLINKIGVNNV
jgi:hypothetical protein